MRYTIFPLVILAIFLLEGCFSGNNSKKHYYQVYYRVEPSEVPPINATVRMKTFEIDKIYKRYNLVYRSSPYELFYYNTHLWAAKPDDMLTDVITAHLKRANIFKEIITKLEKMPDYVLTGRIIAIDEINSGDKWFARVSMTFLFNKFSTGETLLSHTFDIRKEVFNKKQSFLVRAMGEIIEKETEKFLSEIYAELKK